MPPPPAPEPTTCRKCGSPAFGNPWETWTQIEKNAGMVLGLGKNYMRYKWRFLDKCWDHSNPADRNLTPLSEEEKKAFKILGGTEGGFEILMIHMHNSLDIYPCPLKGKCCFCTGIFKGDPPPPESMRGKIHPVMFQHCQGECCVPIRWRNLR